MEKLKRLDVCLCDVEHRKVILEIAKHIGVRISMTNNDPDPKPGATAGKAAGIGLIADDTEITVMYEQGILLTFYKDKVKHHTIHEFVSKMYATAGKKLEIDKDFTMPIIVNGIAYNLIPSPWDQDNTKKWALEGSTTPSDPVSLMKQRIAKLKQPRHHGKADTGQ